MDMTNHGNGIIEVELSRRNLKSLLAKLDGHPPGSSASLYRHTSGGRLLVRAVEDESAYSNRRAGVMHPETERAINGD